MYRSAELFQIVRANVMALFAGGPTGLGAQALAALAALAIGFLLQVALRWALTRQRRAEGEDEAARPAPLARWPLTALAAGLVALGSAPFLAEFGLPTPLVTSFGLLALAVAGVQLVLTVIGRTPLGWLVSVLLLGWAAVSALGLSQALIEALDAPGVVLGKVRMSPWFVLRALVVFAAAFWIANRVGRLIERQAAAETVLSPASRVLFGKLAHFALLILAGLIGLAMIGVDITALAVFSGALGLGLGFGLQRIASNFLAGLILLADKSVKPGDVIEVFHNMTSTRGRVTALTARHIAITSRLGTEMLVPNEMLIANPVTNWSHSSDEVQIRIPVRVAYTSDVELALKLCQEAAHRPTRVLRFPATNSLITGFSESAVDLEVRFWIRDSQNGVKNVAGDVYLEIWKAFRAAGVEIPVAQHDLHFRGAPLDVRVQGGAGPEPR